MSAATSIGAARAAAPPEIAVDVVVDADGWPPEEELVALVEAAVAAAAARAEVGEGAAEGRPVENHVRHLVVHGFLHLVGYDHETDQEAERMERLETEVLASLGVPDPYGSTEAD